MKENEQENLDNLLEKVNIDKPQPEEGEKELDDKGESEIKPIDRELLESFIAFLKEDIQGIKNGVIGEDFDKCILLGMYISTVDRFIQDIDTIVL
jgi:hypothetical protein